MYRLARIDDTHMRYDKILFLEVNRPNKQLVST